MIKLTREALRKSKYVWESPETRNASIILQQVGRGTVLICDLDMGENYVVKLSDLKHKVRVAEESDFDYSWCYGKADEEITKQFW